ncbi:hypothetical protein DAHU10_019660 [Hanseniaspora uvarum]|nr:hypothetical protein DAHU10_019660 [Hanseniaspora uvarum]
MVFTGNDLVNLDSSKSAEKGNTENLFSPPFVFSPIAMPFSSEDVRHYAFNKHDMFDLGKNEIKSMSRATSPIFITQDWDAQNSGSHMKNDIFKPFYEKNSILSSGGSTVMNNEESLDDILSYNFSTENIYSSVDFAEDELSSNIHQTATQTPINYDSSTTNIAPSELIQYNISKPQGTPRENFQKSKSISLATTIGHESETHSISSFDNENLNDILLETSLDINKLFFQENKITKTIKYTLTKSKKNKKKVTENQQDNETIRVQKVFNTKGKSISDSRLSTESLRQSFQLSSATAANKLEEFIEKLLVEHCDFKLGYRTWVRDTEKDERDGILNVLEFQLNKNMDYLYEITGLTKKLEKRSIETIVRKCTYAKQQSRLRKERRKAAQTKTTHNIENL